MAQCDICGKKSMTGHNVSHSNRHTKRQFHPNIQRIKVLERGRWVRIYACARCIKTINKNAKL